MNGRHLASTCIIWIFWAFSSLVNASWLDNLSSSEEENFLPSHQAFQIDIHQEADRLLFSWQVADGYYLYRHSFKLSDAEGNPVPFSLPKGIPYQDIHFGKVEIYRYGVQLEAGTQAPSTLVVQWQGCADKGLCYAPETKQITLSEVPSRSSSASDQNQNEPLDPLQFLLFFLAGVALTFTPCVLPMVPVISSIVTQKDGNPEPPRKAFLLSSQYVLGMAISFSALGALVGWFGGEVYLQAWLQTPIVIYPLAGFFILLSLKFFGLSIPIPLLNRSLSGFAPKHPFLMGAFSSLLLSPCVAAPTAALMVIIAQEGQLLSGALGLFSLALGMGLPILIIGSTGFRILPKGGNWLEYTERLLGVSLIAMAAWLIARLYPIQFESDIIFLGVILGVGLWILHSRKIQSHHIYTPILICALSGILLHTLYAPFGSLSYRHSSQLAEEQSVNWHPISSLDQVKSDSRNKPIIIKVWAEWCTSCRVMDRTLERNAEVKAALAAYSLYRVDITQSSPEARAFMAKHNLFGPPAYLKFSNQNELIELDRLIGENDAKSFLKFLKIR